MKVKDLIQELSKLPQDEESKLSCLWKCERCGKLIPYMADFCHECTNELFGEPPKPFELKKGENEEKYCDNCQGINKESGDEE